LPSLFPPFTAALTGHQEGVTMKENIKQIAQRIKALREISGMSIADLAREFKVSKSQYEKFESGAVDIPVSFLYEVAHKLNVELTVLITGEEPRLHQYSLVRQGKAPAIERRKEYNYQDLSYNFIHKKAETFLVTVDPKPARAEVHYYNHPGQEFNYVLEGALKMMLDGHEIVLKKGDSLYFDSGYNHAMAAIGKKPAKFLAIIL
jgi:transcriptional regulator with XRE-family HTH domain